MTWQMATAKKQYDHRRHTMHKMLEVVSNPNDLQLAYIVSGLSVQVLGDNLIYDRQGMDKCQLIRLGNYLRRFKIETQVVIRDATLWR